MVVPLRCWFLSEIEYVSLCGCLYRPHCEFCPSVCQSLSRPVCHIHTLNSIKKGVDKQKLAWTFPSVGVIVLPVFTVKGHSCNCIVQCIAGGWPHNMSALGHRTFLVLAFLTGFLQVRENWKKSGKGQGKIFFLEKSGKTKKMVPPDVRFSG